MNQAITLAFLFSMIGEIIMRFAIVGGGVGLAIAYIYWAALRWEDNLLKFLLAVGGPALFACTVFNVLTEYGVLR